MKTIRQLNVPQDSDNAKFPDGQIINETDTSSGTPVVREVYGDVLTNMYKIVRESGLVPNGQEDSENSGYQLLNALKVFVNDTNDKCRLLTVNGKNITANLDFDRMPDDYVFIGKVSSAVTKGEDFTLISGQNGTSQYSTTIKNNVEALGAVLVVLGKTKTTIFGIGADTQEEKKDTSVIYTPFGTPLSYNDSNEIYYLSNGFLLHDAPRSVDLVNTINNNTGRTHEVVDAVIFKNTLVCMCFEQATLTYEFFAFNGENFANFAGKVQIQNKGGQISDLIVTGVDNQPYMFCNNLGFFFTNSFDKINETVIDENMLSFYFDENGLFLKQASSFIFRNIWGGSKKTTNSFFGTAPNELNFYTFTKGSLKYIDLYNALIKTVGYFPAINGTVFKFDGHTYYSNGNVAVRWDNY